MYKKLRGGMLALVFLCGGIGYASNPVAVNERTQTQYEDLQSALSDGAVLAGDRIKLLREVDEVSELTTLPVSSFAGVLVEKDVILDGAGYEIKRPRDYLGTLFTIGGGTNVTFSGVVIDGQAPGWNQNFEGLPNKGYINVPIIVGSGDLEATGNTILNAGNLNLFDSTLKNILVSGKNVSGAGIKTTKGSNLTIKKTLFKHIGGKSNHGGAITVDSGAKLIIKDTIFDNTVAAGGHYLGGAICIWGGADDKLVEIENSEFRNAHAMNGGAIYLAASAIKISKSKFIANSAGNDGSAIQFSTAANSSLKDLTTDIEDTLFSGNIGLATADQSMGTIVFGTYNGKGVNIIRSQFIGNINAAGSAIADFGGSKVKVIIDNSRFIKNESDGVVYSKNMDVTIKDSIITGNISRKNNSAVASVYYYSTLMLENTLVENNGVNSGNLSYAIIQLRPGINSGHTQLFIQDGTVIRDNVSSYAAVLSSWKNDATNAKSTIMMEPGAKVYNNKGIIGGSDFYFFRDASANVTSFYDIKVQPAVSMQVKDVKGEDIVGRFSDRSNKRFSPIDFIENPEPLVVGGDGMLTYSGIPHTAVALKAASKDTIKPALQLLDTQIFRRNKLINIPFTGRDNLKIASVEVKGVLPTGLSFQKKEKSDMDRDLLLTGIVSKTGVYPLSFLITDALGNTGSMTFDLKITKPSTSDNTSGVGSSVLITQKDEVQDSGVNLTGISQKILMTGEDKKIEENQIPEIKEGKLLYPEVDIYNPSILNGQCYTRRNLLGIKDSATIMTSEEFKKALSFLWSYEMTRFDSVEGFAPKRNLTREEAAKIFSQFAMNVLCRKPDLNLHTHYSDTTNANSTLKPYIELAYQLGIMKGSGKGDGEFRPFDAISKAEVNAVLIRMILKSYLDESKIEGRKWYAVYNQVATTLGIITKDAGREALSREYLALMLFRAYKNQVFEWRNIDYFSYVLEKRDSFVK